MKEQLRSRAIMGDTSILVEYSDDQLKQELDEFGWNAFHYLAQLRKTKILNFKDAFQLRNKNGKTAVEILLSNCDIDREVLAKFFPWYTPRDGETIKDSIECIKRMSNGEDFVLNVCSRFKE
jgi:hypothetical protein